MTAPRTADDDHGYGGDAPAYDVSGASYCSKCDAYLVWPETHIAHSEAHTAARVVASEVADAEPAAIRREIRRDDVRGGSEA